MTDVSVIGTGMMGAAVAHDLIRRGLSVTVWNRTPEKTAPLVLEGASAASSARAAIGASPVSIIIVAGYPVVRELLLEAEEFLPSRDVINMSTGTPYEATELASFVGERGGRLLEACILTYPSEIGTPEAGLKYSGEESVWASYADMLKPLGGRTAYLGSDVQLANVMDAAVLTAYLPAITAVLEAGAFAAANGLPFAELEGAIIDMIPLQRDFVARVRGKADSADYEVEDTSLDIYLAGAQGVVETMDTQGYRSFMMKASRDAMQLGSDRGRGTEDLFVLYDVLRNERA